MDSHQQTKESQGYEWREVGGGGGGGGGGWTEVVEGGEKID